MFLFAVILYTNERKRDFDYILQQEKIVRNRFELFIDCGKLFFFFLLNLTKPRFNCFVFFFFLIFVFS